MPAPWYNHNGWLGVKHQVTYLLAHADWRWMRLLLSWPCSLRYLISSPFCPCAPRHQSAWLFWLCLLGCQVSSISFCSWSHWCVHIMTLVTVVPGKFMIVLFLLSEGLLNEFISWPWSCGARWVVVLVLLTDTWSGEFIIALALLTDTWSGEFIIILALLTEIWGMIRVKPVGLCMCPAHASPWCVAQVLLRCCHQCHLWEQKTCHDLMLALHKPPVWMCVKRTHDSLTLTLYS